MTKCQIFSCGLIKIFCKVPLDSIASHSGCKSGDYLVKINGENVFNLGHEEAKDRDGHGNFGIASFE